MHGGGCHVPGAHEVAAESLTGQPGSTGGDELEGVPGLGLGAALGDGGHCPLGEGQSLAELAVDGGWCGHGLLTELKDQ